MRMEEENSPTQPKEASDIPVEQRISATWLDFSDKISEEGRKGLVGYKKAVPRASARYALNPGLFEDWRTDRVDFTQYASPRNNGALASPPSTIRQDSLASDDSGDHPWIDFDAVEQMISLPPIEETLPSS